VKNVKDRTGYLQQSVQAKMGLPIVVGAILVLGVSLAIMFRVKTENTQLVGLSSAQAVANQITSLRTFYTAEVVSRARKSGMKVNYDFAQKEDTLPLPATLVKSLGDEIRKSFPGTSVRLYSRFPFPHRAATEKYDEFETAALTALERNPQTAFYRLEDVNGRLSIRYAVADMMRAACVECHNTHPESPKKDWREGDVRGVVEVIVPVDEAETGLLVGTRNIGLVIGGGLALLAVLLLGSFRRLVMKPINTLMTATDRVEKGDLQARAEVFSQDELGSMTSTFNAMLDHTKGLIETREQERDALQTSIMRLMSEVADVAQGDLTTEAAVTEDATGAIADAFNYMIAELRRIIAQVQEATLQVNSSVGEIQTTTDRLAQGSQSQLEQIVATTRAISEMADSIQQVSQSATISATIGDQALRNAQQGAEAVERTVGEMDRIQEQVRQTAETIGRLGERSKEIGEIAQLIGSVARRTSVLALNSSIQAALAGEAGVGFAAVSQEIEQLAVRSDEAAKQVGALINAIQTETKQAVAAMETTVREVTKGAQMADEAGQALQEIQSVSNHLAEVVQSISRAATQQAQGSETLTKSMIGISAITREAADNTTQVATSIVSLTALADSLSESVSRFKLSNDGDGHNGRRRFRGK